MYSVDALSCVHINDFATIILHNNSQWSRECSVHGLLPGLALAMATTLVKCHTVNIVVDVVVGTDEHHTVDACFHVGGEETIHSRVIL